MLVREAWVDRLLTSDEPAARWIALTRLAGAAVDDPAAVRARQDVLADARTTDLLDRLVPWEVENRISGHHVPTFAPHLLGLLLDTGVRPGDDERIGACLDAMTRHVSPEGRFESIGTYRGRTTWASLPCDHHAVLEVLVRAGRGDEPAVRRGVEVMGAALVETPQGQGWQCVPDARVGFRGPGRRADVCPQVTLQALRVFSLVGPDQRPPGLGSALRTPLEVWRRRGAEHPYMFGHGRSFKEGRWPAVWYSALAVVETLGRFPQIWSGPDAGRCDRRAVAELGACVRAYVLDAGGRVVPWSTSRGFEAQTFGRKGRPSDVATALVLRALARLAPIAADVEAVDVLALDGAKGGSGRPRPPRVRG